MTNLQLLNQIEKHLTLARMQRSHLAAIIYAVTSANSDACNLLLTQLQKLAEQDETVDKLLDFLYDRLAHPQVGAQD